MKVLLVYPCSANELIGYGDLGAIAEPLALEYLAAGLELDQHDVQILDLRLHRGALEEALRTFAPEVVGVTGYSMHVLRNLEICRAVRAALPQCFTVVGGHHATLMPEDFFTAEVDFVVSGEGTASLRQLLRYLANGVEVRDVPGVWSRSPQESDRFCYGGDQPRLQLDQLPRPNRTLVGMDRRSYFIDWMKPIALLRTSVGCPYRCSFCSLWRIMEGRYHTRTHAGIVEELRQVPEECVFLVDDEPFINRERMASLAQAIGAAKITKRYFAYCRMDTLLRQADLIRQWRAIGLERLFIGIESISDEGLLSYNKRLQVTQIEEGLALARQLGIHIFAGFVVDTNYEKRDFARLVRFIEHHQIDYPSFTVLTPIPGTPALASFDHIVEKQTNGRPNWDLFDLQHAVTETRLPREEFADEYRRLYKVFNRRYVPYRGSGGGAVLSVT
jgi:radical SAM superfamily enzyme YgiQ (UPF0313 family)